MAALGKGKSPKKKPAKGPRRVSPLKPGLTGARNWATAQMRSASYSRKSMTKLIVAGAVLFFTVVWGALWLGGFLPQIQSAGDRMVKSRLMSMGFVVDHVDVVGEGRVSEIEVKKMLGVEQGDYLFDMDIQSAQSRIQSISWVETAVVRRLWPNRVVVHINERIPYALWQHKGEFSLVDHTGNSIITTNVSDYASLPLVVGAGAATHADELITQLRTYPALMQRVDALIYVGERRWDVLLDQDLRIMLPAHGAETALAKLDKFNREHNLVNRKLARIDLRLPDRVSLLPISAKPDRT